MGRPPIGKRAMTATERQRRWRAKSRANKPAPKPAVRTVKQLQARVRQLEADRAALIAAMGKLLHVMAQRLRCPLEEGAACARPRVSSRACPSAERSRQPAEDPAGQRARRTQARGHSDRLSQANVLAAGPGLERGRRAAGAGTAGQSPNREPRQGPSREGLQSWLASGELPCRRIKSWNAPRSGWSGTSPPSTTVCPIVEGSPKPPCPGRFARELLAGRDPVADL